MLDRLPPSQSGDVDESRAASEIPMPNAFVGERREATRLSATSVLATNFGARPKGRPQYVPQWALPEGIPAYSPPPAERALPSWAVVRYIVKSEAPPTTSSMTPVGAQPLTARLICWSCGGVLHL